MAACALLMMACATPAPPPADLPAAAITARGGFLERFTRRSELVVHYGFPGRWRWELSFQRPDRFRLVLDTTGDSQTFASDGRMSRIWHGNALVTEEPTRESCFSTLARWLAMASLDALNEPGIHWSVQTAETGLPPGVAHVLTVRCADDPDADFELHFDRSLRLVAAAGPVSIPGLAAGRLAARFHDFRRSGRYTLPFAIDYTLDGRPFFEERIEELIPDDPALTAGAFAQPGLDR
jgi:hypothetical protein